MVEILSYRRYPCTPVLLKNITGFSFIFVRGVIKGKGAALAALPKFSDTLTLRGGGADYAHPLALL